MSGSLRSYTILCIVESVCALLLLFVLYAKVPIQGNPWWAVAWFSVFATLIEAQAVCVSATGSSVITPTSPINWAATCVLGPVPAMVFVTASGVLFQVAAWAAYRLSRALAGRIDVNDLSSQRSIILKLFYKGLSRVGNSWHPDRFIWSVQVIAMYVAVLMAGAGLSGMAYRAVGGRFLYDLGGDSLNAHNFVLPFFLLVTVAIIVEHSHYVIGMNLIKPVPGSRGIYGYLLGAKLIIIEEVLPVWRGQIFLSVVALLLAYLYAKIGIWGFIFAIMPVLALRDFFNQWVEERAAYLNTITTLATYMQHYHPYTRGHLKRVAEISERLARELKLPAESVRHMRTAGLVHDIGKIAVSEEILDKTGKLTDEEWEKIKEHPVKGAEIISHLEFLEEIVDWIKFHHKWYNGSGYPASDDSKLIPIEASIIAVADSFDAMTDDRELALDWRCDTCGFAPEDDIRPEACPRCGAQKRRTYREPKTLDQAIDELRRGAGSQFHPHVVKAFMSMVERDGIHLNA